MKLTLPVPIEKVPVGSNGHRFRHEPREVVVQHLTRYRAGSDGVRYHYHAHYDHPDAHPDAPRSGHDNMLCHWIRRADHPRWKPPVFPGGCASIDVRERQAEGEK